ncbi:hypothetical protein [Phytomonospora endophytica]|uniref:Uncharacterized protein n=1 Tax=Phytomonospora endophytica TaxID=714109 RepID=A0A841FJ15_9ACTN|nr:hypothetical protein [Phytomonospora endophytica]MBB6033542.1 hypothetical protein [Phytomonospora endophytica]
MEPGFWRLPFTAVTWRRWAYVITGGLLAPLLLLPMLAGLGAGVERARSRWVRDDEPLPRPGWRRGALYAVVNLPLSLGLGLFFAYLTTLWFYWVAYPVLFWNADLSEGTWGGPTWIGAVSLHVAPAPIMLFAGPWLLRHAARLHAALVRRVLG